MCGDANRRLRVAVRWADSQGFIDSDFDAASHRSPYPPRCVRLAISPVRLAIPARLALNARCSIERRVEAGGSLPFGDVAAEVARRGLGTADDRPRPVRDCRVGAIGSRAYPGPGDQRTQRLGQRACSYWSRLSRPYPGDTTSLRGCRAEVVLVTCCQTLRCSVPSPCRPPPLRHAPAVAS